MWRKRVKGRGFEKPAAVLEAHPEDLTIHQELEGM
jgi:hypothetical protein